MFEQFLHKFGEVHKKVGAMTAARAVNVIAALVVMMVLTRILEPVEYGAYKKLWLIFMLFSPGITSMLVKTLYFRGELSGHRAAIWTAIFVGAVSSLIISVIIALASTPLAWAVQAPEISEPMRWFALYILFATYSSVAEPIFVLAERKKWLLGYNLSYNLIESALIVVPFYLGLPLESVIQIMIAGPLLRSVFVTLFAAKQAGVPIWKEVTRELPVSLSYGLGVLLIFITGIGITQIDKLIVAVMFESEELYAIYVVGAQTLPLIPAFISSVSSAIIVQYAAQINSRNYDSALIAIRSATDRLFLIITPIIVVCFFLAEPIMVVLFDQYAESAPIFQIYAITTIYKLFLAETLLLATGRTRIIAVFNVGEVILNIPLSLALIEFMGILGPAIATLIAHLIAILALTVYTARTESLRVSNFLPSSKILPLLVSLPVLGGVSFFLIQSGISYFTTVIIGGLLCAGVISFHNRKFAL